MAKRGEGMESLIFPGDATSPTPFGLSSAGLWDDVEVSVQRGGCCVCPSKHKISRSTSKNCSSRRSWVSRRFFARPLALEGLTTRFENGWPLGFESVPWLMAWSPPDIAYVLWILCRSPRSTGPASSVFEPYLSLNFTSQFIVLACCTHGGWLSAPTFFVTHGRAGQRQIQQQLEEEAR